MGIIFDKALGKLREGPSTKDVTDSCPVWEPIWKDFNDDFNDDFR